MTDPSPTVDGITSPDAPGPSAERAAPPKTDAGRSTVQRWKYLLLGIGLIGYLAYIGWCGLLLAMLPSPKEGSDVLVTIGIATSVIGGIVFLGIGLIGVLHIAQKHAVPAIRQAAVLKLGLTVVPGILLSVATPLLIMREPPLVLAVTAPATAEELVAPVPVTFSVEQAVETLRQRGINPIAFRWDIDGDKKTDQETVTPALTVTFDRDGIYDITAEIVGSAGERRAATRRLVILQSAFVVTPALPVVERPVVFDVQNLVPDAEELEEIEWDFDGDGATDEVTTSRSVSYTYFNTGTFTVSALIKLKNATQARYGRAVTVVEPTEQPFPASIVSEPSLLISPAPFATVFRIETDEPVAQVVWNFGDGSRAEGLQTAHTFTRLGTFPLTARVRSQSGAVAELSTVVRVVPNLQLPDLSFGGSPPVNGDRIVGEVPLTVDLQPRTATPFVTFSWEAPDATEVGSTEGRLQAVYRREGVYTISMVAQDAEDRVQRRNITVEVREPTPSLAISMNPETGTAPLTVRFDASESFIGGDERITGFEWSYGDGSPVEFGGARAEHIFTKPGTYVVNLTVRTISGQQYRTNRTIVVREPQFRACILPSRLRGTAPLGIEFSASCTVGLPVSYLWDFGDGSQSDLERPVHVFLDPGEYTVRLTATDAGNAVSSATVSITVEP